jgi:phytoene dehydrogenase-like protein
VVYARGGELLRGHEVGRIQVSVSAVTGGQLRAPDGATRQQLGARVVVSNAHIKPELAHLLSA